MVEKRPSYLAVGAEDVEVASHSHHKHNIDAHLQRTTEHPSTTRLDMVHRHFPVIAGTTFVFLSPIRSDRHPSPRTRKLGVQPRSRVVTSLLRPDAATLSPGSPVVNTVVTHLNARSSPSSSDIRKGTYPSTRTPRPQLRS